MHITCLSHDSPGSRRVLDNILNLPVVVTEANVVGAVLLHGDGPLKGTITDCQGHLLFWRLLDGLGGFVRAVPSNNLAIDLWKKGEREGRKI